MLKIVKPHTEDLNVCNTVDHFCVSVPLKPSPLGDQLLQLGALLIVLVKFVYHFLISVRLVNSSESIYYSNKVV